VKLKIVIASFILCLGSKAKAQGNLVKPLKLIILLFLILSFKQVRSQTNTLNVSLNPFIDTLNVQLYLANNDTVTITVISFIGQIVKTIAYDSAMATGNHIIVYNATSLSSGIYFVNMKAGVIKKIE
jgi:hypothetical protein